jgi:hypothetical protein
MFEEAQCAAVSAQSLWIVTALQLNESRVIEDTLTGAVASSGRGGKGDAS